ncbi:hypothetical protein A628_04748, partial [Salmonella enterica subsp. enterica serovar Cubana str. 76814]
MVDAGNFGGSVPEAAVLPPLPLPRADRGSFFANKSRIRLCHKMACVL